LSGFVDHGWEFCGTLGQRFPHAQQGRGAAEMERRLSYRSHFARCADVPSHLYPAESGDFAQGYDGLE
jgi:hypothetical protein